MKKYRLKVNTVTILAGAVVVEDPDDYHYVYDFYVGSHKMKWILPKEVIENNPDYWELLDDNDTQNEASEGDE